MTESGLYTKARKNFEKKAKDTAVRVTSKVCNVQLADGSLCPATGLYRETFRGDAYHFKGECGAGHKLERFGYAEQPVIDP